MDGTGYDRLRHGGGTAGTRSGAQESPRPPHRDQPTGRLDDIAQVLLAHGAVTTDDLTEARKIKRSLDRPLTEILLARGKLTEADLLTAYAEHYDLGRSDLSTQAPSSELAGLLTPSQAIRFGAVPWRRIGQATTK